MIRTILFPCPTRSLNVSFGGNITPEIAARITWAKKSATKRERKVTENALHDPRFGLNPTIAAINAGVHVDVVRIGVGVLDKVNLFGALKPIQDEVARWIQIDDRDPRITWELLQAKCERSTTPGLPNYQGVRIRIACSTPGPDLDIVCGIGPKRIGPESVDGRGDLPGSSPKRQAERSRVAQIVASIGPASEDRARNVTDAQERNREQEIQQPLPLRTAWIIRPWEQDGTGVPELAEVTLPLDRDPPARITVAVPPMVRAMTQHAKNAVLRLAARTMRLERHEVHHRELGGSALVYAERGCPELAYFDGQRGRAAAE